MSLRPTSGGPKLKRLNMGQVFILLALVSAVLTVVMFKKMSGPGAPKELDKAKTRSVVVAKHQLFAGEVINSDSVKVVEWPEDLYPESGVYETTHKLIGRVVKKDLFAGEPVYKLSLAGTSSMGGLPVLIPPGYRAMTISVTESKGVAGFIKPGSRVDIIGTFEFEIPETSQKKLSDKSGVLLQDSIDITQTVLQNVQVLAIAQEMYEKKSVIEETLEDKPKESKDKKQEKEEKEKKSDKSKDKESNESKAAKAKIVSSVTLAVTPEQAEKLAYADERGDLRLTLRSENDNEELALIGAVSEDIIPLQNLYEKLTKLTAGFNFSGPEPPVSQPSAPLPPPAPLYTVEVIEGASKNTRSF